MSQEATAFDDKHYDRTKVVQIVHSVIAKMEGLSGESLRTLTKELQDLVTAIERTKAELASARTADLGNKDVPTATDELDAVVDATKGATDSIMSACEAMEKMVMGRGDAIEQGIIGEVTKIYEACTFQDITGQRIRKVVSVLRQVEGKVGHLLETLGHTVEENQLAVQVEDNRTEEQKLMNGPQLPANAISQDEIDKLLASF
ncbi:MAG: protein phosphatase CheZ [Alphaproteobacteria bacterium]|nr:protein phosphatase CheZ [Alphaproteobacteria bacterium]